MTNSARMHTRDSLTDAIGQAYGAWYWRRPGLFAFKPGPQGRAERVALILRYRALRKAFAAGDFSEDVNERGNVILRNQHADRAIRLANAGSRYAYDCGPCRNWQQLDTWQDASYFGVWVHPTTRRIFTYCEGDRILVTCPTPASFRAELADARDFYRATLSPALQADSPR
jgi:hypothetical protein